MSPGPHLQTADGQLPTGGFSALAVYYPGSTLNTRKLCPIKVEFLRVALIVGEFGRLFLFICCVLLAFFICKR